MNFQTQTPNGSTFPPPGGHVVLRSPQYGPAWVADCYGTTHEERLAAVRLFESGSGTNCSMLTGEDPDQVARAYATILDNQIGVTL